MSLHALTIARYLAECGVPIFLARPSDDFPRGGSDGNGYWLPRRWQTTKPDPSVLDDWEPGMAVCAVMGHTVDALDLDPRNGGEVPDELRPTSYGQQATPSGGTHDLIAPLGIRSKDGALPGVDLKAGVDGLGVGFVYIAPTVKMGKDGEVGQYEWTGLPDLDQLVLIGGDESGRGLADHVRASRAKSADGSLSYSGPDYDELTQTQQKQADQYLKVRLDMWREQLAAAAEWPEGQRDGKGRGWEALARDAAWVVASAAVCPWLPLDEDTASRIYLSLLPEVIAADDKCKGKWYDGLIEKASAQPVDQPPWADFDPIELSVVEAAGIPQQLDDAHMADWMASTGLKRGWCWARGMGWMQWDAKRWVTKNEESAREVVRRAVIEVNTAAAQAGADTRTRKALAGLLSLGRISSLTTLMRGVVERDPSMFDSEPHLLNVGNGVVNLRTGALLPHDPAYLLTKITDTPFLEGATHPDWVQALKSLEPEVADWMQIRFGQGTTGEQTSDDILPIGQGQGSNGKTTLITAIKSSLGEHVVHVPEKLIRASPNDHPTELMSLHGARIALLDETPEVAQLNVQRLKAVLGSEWITARHVHRDNITWKATHSLFVMTNYVPIVRETDKGTWRRLALVKFDKTFPPDDQFRSRMARGEDGRKEAVLAWIVEGARRWYQNGMVIPPPPPKVAADTKEWRGESNLAMAYADERLVFQPGSSVLFRELADDLNQWLQTRGMTRWSDQLIITRMLHSEQFEHHKVHKLQTRSTEGLSLRYGDTDIPARIRVWQGIRWRTDEDE